ncbi:MAG TPA: alpha-L-fucosidase [Chitinophagaceae bacterium]|nr:alpha-L-fucosidase [Chitinophagaceae bacterium]
MKFRFILLFILFSPLEITLQAQSRNATLPTLQQVAWANDKIGVIIHLDIDIFAPETYHYGKKETLPALSVFHPSRLNTDQWIRAAKSAGAKYAVLVAKHGTGFALWPTRANKYNVGQTPWRGGKGDIVADFIKSCKKYGIRPGIYYSVNSSTLYQAGNDMTDSARKAYNQIVLEQLTELWTHYGKLFEIWFDGGIRPTSQGGVSDQLAAMIKKYQPQAILFQGPATCKNLIRWVGNERGDAPYPMWSRADTTTHSHGMVEIKDLHGNPDGAIWCPAESDFPSRKKSAWEGGWFWRANRPQDVISLNDMVGRYYTTVGRNTNMLIGMAIDTAGLFPEKETHLFAQFGNEIKKRFGHSLAETKGNGNELILNLGNHPVRVNQVVIMETLTHGENIRKYAVEAWVNNKWEPVCDGISVGHERIQTFTTVETTRLRLKITASQTPDIKKFAAYDVKDL